MKKIFLLIVIFCGFLVLLPQNVLADAVNEFKCTNSRDNDGLVLKNCTFKATITGNSRFNHTEGKFIIKNMNIISVQSNANFVLDFNKTSNYIKLTSNHVYTSQEGEVIYGTLVAKQADYNIKECNIGYEPVKTGHEDTNVFNITKEAYKDGAKIKEVKMGEEFQYKITVTSGNNVLLTDSVTVSDVIPEELEIISAEEGNINGQTITWNLGTFPIGVHTKVLTVNVRAKKDIKGTVKNTAILKVGDNTFKDDESTNIVYSDIRITKKASRDKVSSEEEFYYIITVENIGTGISNEVIVQDDIAETLTFKSATPKYTNENHTYYFNMGTLKAKETKTIRINVKAPKVTENKTILNTAIATEEGQEPKTDEETVEITTEDIKPDIKIQKKTSKTKVKKGEEFTFIITVTNNNSLNLTDVVVKDLIDNNLKIVAAPNATITNNLVTWNLELKGNEKKELTIIVKAISDKSDKITNKAIMVHENKETPSNEVEVTITKSEDSSKPNNPNEKDPDIENPKTGSIISYVILGSLTICSLLIYWYVKTKKKFYRL